MSGIVFVLVTFLSSVLAGIVGALLGLGGGVVMVPVLTLFLGVHIYYAAFGLLLLFLRDSLAAAHVSQILHAPPAAHAYPVRRESFWERAFGAIRRRSSHSGSCSSSPAP